MRRHSAAGRRAAGGLSDLADPDELVDAAFEQIRRTLKRGVGPISAFRPYLYTTIRNIAVRRAGKAGRKRTAEEVEAAKDPIGPAFDSLPAQSQAALWYADVEHLPVQSVGELTGIEAGAVGALVIRSRIAFGAAWLGAQFSQLETKGAHRDILLRLPHLAQGALRPAEAGRVDEHLELCQDCRRVADDLKTAGSRLGATLLVLTLGGAAAAVVLSGSMATAASGAASTASHGAFHVIKSIAKTWTPRGIAIAATAGTAATVAGGGIALAAAGVFGPIALPGGASPAELGGIHDGSSLPETAQDPEPTPTPGGPTGSSGPSLGSLRALGLAALPSLVGAEGLTAQGTGMPGATVVATSAWGVSWTASVGRDGSWRISLAGLPDGVSGLSFVEQKTVMPTRLRCRPA